MLSDGAGIGPPCTVARHPRLQYAGGVYHVMARGNRKATIFLDDEDRRRFFQVIDRAVVDYALRILSACLMGNHYHLVLETPERNLSDAMQFINGVFAQRSNRRYGQTGHVFEGRFRSLVIQRESYLLRAARYVVRNPVRASLVPEAAGWPWSSYRATAGLEPVPRWLHVDWIKWAFKTDSLDEARRRYVEYVNSATGPKHRFEANAIALGSKRFRTRLLDGVRAGKIDRPAPRVMRAMSRPSLIEIFERRTDSAASRDRLIYSARVQYGYRFAEIARVLGIDRTTASKAASRCHMAHADIEAMSD
jgi:putative transposase